jgi:hypothetical protein
LAREQYLSPAAAHPVSHSIRYLVEIFHSFQSFQVLVYRKYTIYDLLLAVKRKHALAGQLFLMGQTDGSPCRRTAFAGSGLILGFNSENQM